MILPTMFWMYKYHPHQYVYFNFLTGKDFNKKFEMDYWGLSNKAAIEHIASKEDKIVKIAKIGTTDLYAAKNILEKGVTKKISITEDIDNAKYIINAYRDWTGKMKIQEYKPPQNFKLFYEIKVDGVAINTIYRKMDNF